MTERGEVLQLVLDKLWSSALEFSEHDTNEYGNPTPAARERWQQYAEHILMRWLEHYRPAAAGSGIQGSPIDEGRDSPDDAWFRGGVDRELVRAVCGAQKPCDKPLVPWDGQQGYDPEHEGAYACGNCGVELRMHEAPWTRGEADTLRKRVLRVVERMGWSTCWSERGAVLHLEASELIEAVRGKRGDTLEESADVLITLLALSPHELDEIVERAERKLVELRQRGRA